MKRNILAIFAFLTLVFLITNLVMSYRLFRENEQLKTQMRGSRTEIDQLNMSSVEMRRQMHDMEVQIEDTEY